MINPIWAIDRFSDPVSTDVVVAMNLAERLHSGQATLLPNLSAAAHLIVENEGWKTFGFANARDFARERLDRTGRWLRNLAMLAEPFLQFPEFQDAAAGLDGKPPLGRAAAYEIARVATPTNITHWIERARTLPFRSLKLETQLAGAGGTIEAPGTMNATGPVVCANQPTNYMSTVDAAVPVFIVEATNELEEVYKASNVAGTRAEYIDSLIAEYRTSLAPSAQTPAIAPEAVRSSVTAGTAGSTGGTTSDCPRVRTAAPRRMLSFAKLRAENQYVPDGITQQDQGTSAKAIQMARWTLHRIESLEGSPDDLAENCRAQADARGSEGAFRRIHVLLELEDEIDLRIAQLLLFIEKRGAWPALGYNDAVEFGRTNLRQSASTTRARLRVARAMEASPCLNKACESGFTQQRALRIVAFLTPAAQNEPLVRLWIDHARNITIKRLDDEIRAFSKTIDGVDDGAGAGTGGTAAVSAEWPAPLSDEAWYESIRRAPGDARALLAKYSLAALVELPTADVFLELRLPAAIATELRVCMREALSDLLGRAMTFAGASASTVSPGKLSPAEEVRQRPSVRLALRYVEGGRRLPLWLGLLAMLEEFAEQWDNPQLIQKRPTDAITSRDGWRCTAPGCTARSLEVHHIVYQSHGGSDADDNLTSLCPFHHRMGEHGSLSTMTGKAPLRLHWRLGVGHAGAHFRNERRM